MTLPIILIVMLGSICAVITATALLMNYIDGMPSRKKQCKHERFVIDKQIRVIQCKKCGMRSWLEKDHVDLF